MRESSIVNRQSSIVTREKLPHRTKPRCGRRALTLVEVLAALVLLAGTVTALLLAQSRVLQQQSATAERYEASQLAGELIQQWRLMREDLSVSAVGTFDARAGWAWRRTGEEFAAANGKRLFLVHLEIIRLRDSLGPQTICDYEWLECPGVRP